MHEQGGLYARTSQSVAYSPPLKLISNEKAAEFFGGTTVKLRDVGKRTETIKLAGAIKQVMSMTCLGELKRYM